MLFLCCNDCIRIHYTNESMPVQSVCTKLCQCEHNNIFSPPPIPPSFTFSFVCNFIQIVLFCFHFVFDGSIESFSFALLCIVEKVLCNGKFCGFHRIVCIPKIKLITTLRCKLYLLLNIYSPWSTFVHVVQYE